MDVQGHVTSWRWDKDTGAGRGSHVLVCLNKCGLRQVQSCPDTPLHTSGLRALGCTLSAASSCEDRMRRGERGARPTPGWLRVGTGLVAGPVPWL